MSTATTTSGGYAECDEFIEHRIRVARSRIKWTDLLTALLLAGVLLIGYVLIFTLCDHWVVDGGFAPVTRAVMLGVVVLLCAAIVYRYVIRPWTKEIHPLYAAKMLDNQDGSMDGALMSAVDLGANQSAASETVRRSIEKRAALGLAEVNIDEAIDRKWLMNLGITLFFLVLFTCVYAVFSPKSINLLRPLSLSNAAVATQTRILRVQPGSTMIQAGEELEIIVDIAGNMPEAVHVLFTTQDQTYVDEQLTMSTADDAGRYRVTMVGDSDRGLRQNFTYRIVAGDAASEAFEVVVDEPPTANVSQVKYVYPDYMSLPERSTRNGNIDAWEGTDVFLTAETNVPVRLAIVKFSDDASFTIPAEEFSLTPDGNLLTGRLRLKLREDGTTPKFYRIDVTDVDGRMDPQPTVYSMKIRPDKKPIVKLLDPIRDMRVPANAIVPLLVEAEDPDFLLRSVKLEIEVNGVPQSDQILFDATRAPPTNVWNGTWDFDLKPFALKEGDVVRYQVSARDNKPLLGSQQRTTTLQLFIEQRVAEERVQQQLKEDRELQQQQQRDNNPGQNSDAGETAETKNSEEDARADDNGEMNSETTDSSDEGQPGQTKNPNNSNGSDSPAETAAGPDGQPSDQSDPDGVGESSVKESGPDGEEGSADGEKSSTGSSKDESADGESGRQKEKSDDEALQEILDAYKDKMNAADDVESGEDGAGDAGVERPESGEPNDGFADTLPKNDDGSTDSDASMEGAAEPENPGEPGDTANDGMTKDPGQDNNADQPRDGGANEDSVPKDDGAPQANDPKDDADQDNQQPGNGNKDQQRPDDKQGDPSDKQNGEAGKQGDPSDKQNGDPGKQGDPSDKQNGDPGEQGDPSDKQNGEAGKQGDPSDKQNGEAGKQGDPSDKQNGDPGKQGDPSDKQNGESGKQGDPSDKQNGESGKQGEQSGKQNGESGKQGEQSGKQNGESGKQGEQSGKQNGESGKQGEQSGKQSSKGGEGKGGEGKGGEGKGGEGKGGEGKGGEGKGGEGKGGEGKGGEGKGGEGKGGEGKGGEGKGGEGKGGEGKGGEGKGGEGKGGEGKGGEGKGGEGKGGEGKGCEGKGGEGKGGEGKGGEGKGGEGKGGEGKGGEGKGGEGKGGEGKGGEGKGGQGKGGQGKGGQGKGGQGDGRSSSGSGKGESAPGDAQAGPKDPGNEGGGGGGESSADFTPDEANVTDAAQAADLVLKRLKKDLDRGRVDKELLEKLGWTEDQLQAFGERIQKQLNNLNEPTDEASRVQKLQNRRLEEVLKSLNLKSKSGGQIGSTRRNSEQQDTTIRRSPVPARYKDRMEFYERSLSEGSK